MTPRRLGGDPTRRAVVAAAATVAIGPRHAFAQSGLPVASDLQRDIVTAASRGEPLVLLVTLAGCAYCEIVRRNYLRPLRDAGQVVQQIDLRSHTGLRGPRGEAVREAELARRWKVGMTPTVLFLGPGGVELAPRLVGFSEDFYGGYLDDALTRARGALRAERR